MKGNPMISAKLRRLIEERSQRLCENIIDGRRCMSPGDWRGQHYHHVVHRSQGGGDELSNLLLVCPKCHDRFHLGTHRPAHLAGGGRN